MRLHGKIAHFPTNQRTGTNVLLSWKCEASWENPGVPMISSPSSTVFLWECEGTGFVPGFSVLNVDLGIWVTRPGFRWFGCSFGRRGRDGGEFTKSTQSKSGKINPEIQSAPEKSSQLSNPHPHKDFQLNFIHKFLRIWGKLWKTLIKDFSYERSHSPVVMYAWK